MSNISVIIRWTAILCIVFLSTWAATTIEINDNAFDLLPSSAVREDLSLLQELGLVNRVIITLSLENDTADAQQLASLKKSTAELGRLLRASPLFNNVLYRVPQQDSLEVYRMVQSNLPLLMNETDLKFLHRATTADHIEKALKEAFVLLNSPAGYGMQQQIVRDPLNISRGILKKLEHLKAGYDLQVNDGLFFSKDQKHTLLIAESAKQLTDANSAAAVGLFLTHLFQNNLEPGITPRIIGSLPHTLANARAVKSDLKVLLPIATLLLLSLLFAAFRSPRSLLVLTIPLLAAPTAIYLTTLIHGQISALALGFGIVLLGIAVDFAIHIYIGLAGSADKNNIQRRIRKPILLATATTATVFTVILFSDVVSHRQMATLALSGLLLAVCYSWLLVPTVVPGHLRRPLWHGFLKLRPLSAGSRWALFCLWILLLAGGLYCWSNLSYNGDLQTLDAPNEKVIADEHHFKEIWGAAGDNAFMVASGSTLDQALEANYAIYLALLQHGSLLFQSCAPLLPAITNQLENQQIWQSFWQSRVDFKPLFSKIARHQGYTVQSFQPFFNSLENVPAPHSVWQDFPQGLKMVVQSMIREPFPAEDDGLKQYLVTTTVVSDDTLYPILQELERSSDDITLLAGRKWQNQVERSLRHDIVVLSLTAAAAITIITLVFFRSLTAAAAVLAPVLSALAAMAIFSSVTGNDLNMMHLLMGIMVIGLAVDYGIFTVCSAQGEIDTNAQLAVSICALSSLIGFGVLSLAQHPALHSLGVTVLVGIGTAWPTALFISPLLLAKKQQVVHRGE